MSLKEKIQRHRELSDYRRDTKKRMAEAGIRRMQAEEAANQKKHRLYRANSGDKQAEQEHFAEVAEDLSGLDDHLLMVTNFGGSEWQAARIAEALRESCIPLDIPIGISTHEHQDRPELVYDECARALARALQEGGYTQAPSEHEIAGLFTQTGRFSGSLRVGAEHTAGWYEKPAQEVLHISVVSSLDTNEVGIPKQVSIDGTANLYRGIVPETGLPVWNQIADSQRY